MESQAQRAGIVFRCLRCFFRRLAFGFLHLTVWGLEQVPVKGGAVIAGNHPSVLDGLLLLAVSPRPVRFLVAEDLYAHRYLNPFFRMLGCIPVYRTKTHNGDALRAAVAALEAGELLGIFPEGTIHYHGSMQELKRGVALLALKTGAPVVPLAIRGTFEAFPDGARVPHPRPVHLQFGTPVMHPKTVCDPIPNEAVVQTLEDVRQRILHTIEMTPQPTPEDTVFPWVKDLHVALCSCIVVPLAGFLTLTANQSLDPVKKAHA